MFILGLIPMNDEFYGNVSRGLTFRGSWDNKQVYARVIENTKLEATADLDGVRVDKVQAGSPKVSSPSLAERLEGFERKFGAGDADKTHECLLQLVDQTERRATLDEARKTLILDGCEAVVYEVCVCDATNRASIDSTFLSGDPLDCVPAHGSSQGLQTLAPQNCRSHVPINSELEMDPTGHWIQW